MSYKIGPYTVTIALGTRPHNPNRFYAVTHPSQPAKLYVA